MPVGFMSHKGKEILYIDHRNLMGDKMLNNMKDAVNLVMKTNKKDLLVLADFNDASISNEIAGYLNTEEVKKYSEHVVREALVGITGIKKILFSVYNAFTGSKTKLFNTIEEAKDYLVS